MEPISHSWDLTPSEAIALQKELAAKISVERPAQKARFIAGLDMAFSRDEAKCYAACVLWDRQEQCVVEESYAICPLVFPYVPGLLTFREGPALLEALKGLKHKPDMLMCDGQGLAHQRRLGIACHLGLWTGLPAVGCGKTRLVGKADEPGAEKGSITLLIDKEEIVGAVVRTRTGVKPVFVSVGHKTDLEHAIAAVMDCALKYRLPEPTRLADQLAARIKLPSP